jgi:hypothetical protein
LEQLKVQEPDLKKTKAENDRKKRTSQEDNPYVF